MQPAFAAAFSILALTCATQLHAQPATAPAPAGLPGLTTADAIDPTTRCAIARFRSCDIEAAVARGLFETGLTPVFPEHASCREIDEGYAISYTSKRDREQYHGGIDMPAPWGTPMIAAAAGTVVAKYKGEASYRGIEITLRHAPEDTGIPLWIYTQYAHCAELPALEVGQRVHMGQPLCPTGNTGITRSNKRGHRRPAIHFAVFYSTSDQYADIRDRIVPADGHWMDPIALYRKSATADSATMKALPASEKPVPIPVMFDDGEPHPADTKLIWPYTCSKK
ncbi:MAG: M23 family metallopeptidase [Rhodocyclales bacterium]|nr:M23 family metallopeptidase [Rhodocyclales bacterium]